MWKRLFELVQDVFDLRRQVKGQEKRLGEVSLAQEKLALKVAELSERTMRLELELQYTKEQHAQELVHLREEHRQELARLQEQQLAERQNLRLQLENLILRMQRGLPPSEPPALPAEPNEEKE
jgi:chromosome segregation ATPase